jgi:flagellar basal-body rod protein FlgC
MKIGAQDPYRRREVVLGQGPDGVEVMAVVTDPKPFREVSDPGNPFADSEGKVYYSNVEPIYEMVNMMSASRAYEANIAAFNSTKSMVRAALQIGKI